MRLGFLGPLLPGSDPVVLRRAAAMLLHERKVTRAIYLGDDSALENVVAEWARSLVGDDPSEESTWDRAADLARIGTPEEIDDFVLAQRMRLRLRSLESLPHRILRTMEMVADRIAVLTFDKSILDEEDILSASLLIYGKSDGYLVKRIGARWFLSPGPLGGSAGVCILDDSSENIVATICDAQGNELASQALHLAKPTKMSVQGA